MWNPPTPDAISKTENEAAHKPVEEGTHTKEIMRNQTSLRMAVQRGLGNPSPKSPMKKPPTTGYSRFSSATCFPKREISNCALPKFTLSRTSGVRSADSRSSKKAG